jgi:hypothetical protein
MCAAVPNASERGADATQAASASVHSGQAIAPAVRLCSAPSGGRTAPRRRANRGPSPLATQRSRWPPQPPALDGAAREAHSWWGLRGRVVPRVQPQGTRAAGPAPAGRASGNRFPPSGVTGCWLFSNGPQGACPSRLNTLRPFSHADPRPQEASQPLGANDSDKGHEYDARDCTASCPFFSWRTVPGSPSCRRSDPGHHVSQK